MRHAQTNTDFIFGEIIESISGHKPREIDQGPGIDPGPPNRNQLVLLHLLFASISGASALAFAGILPLAGIAVGFASAFAFAGVVSFAGIFIGFAVAGVLSFT